MQTLILAGGFGTRLSEHTNLIPKPMVKIGNKPILLHIIDIYLHQGFNDFFIAAGYKSEIIKKYFLKKSIKTFSKTQITKLIKKKKLLIQLNNYKVTIIDSGLNSLTGERIKKTFKYMDKKDFFITYGDGLANINLQQLISNHKKNNKLLTVTAVNQPPRFGQLKLDKDTVTHFAEKKFDFSQLISGGFFIMKPKFIEYIKNNSMFEVEPMDFLVKSKKVGAYVHNGFWQCMDSKRDKNLLEEIYKKEPLWLDFSSFNKFANKNLNNQLKNFNDEKKITNKNKKIIRSAKSTIMNSDIDSVIKTLKNEFLGMGPKVEEFESLLSSYFKTNVACVVNGTASLQLALQASGIGKNDEVLVQSMTFLSTYQAISATGAKPISCEIDPNTITIDLKDAIKKINKKTKAIVLVHFSGGVGELNKYYTFAKKNNLILLEDAAHAFGTKYKDKLVGSYNSITSFSFDGIKNITSGEGGCVMSKDLKFINKIKSLRSLGCVNFSQKSNLVLKKSFDVLHQGWRYHMSDIMASIGISQFKRFNKIANKRRSLAKYYDKYLKKLEDVKIIEHNYDDVVPFTYLVTFNSKEIKMKVTESLSLNKIQVSFLYLPNHLLNIYKSNTSLILTEKLYDNSLLLPLHYDLNKSIIRKITNIIRNSI